MKTVIKTENLNKVYRLGTLLRRVRINALDEVNLNIESDHPIIISLVGESGSGKTTLAKVILRLIQPSSGSAIICNQNVVGKGARLEKHEFLSTVQPIFQNPFESFSSYQTVDSYLERTARFINMLKKAEAAQAMEEALHSVGLYYRDVIGKYPNQFSGGELQRISVARALIPRPEIIIADEPVSMIDASLRMNVINLFLKIKETNRTNFLYITHDLATAYYISDYIAVMYRGCIVELGKAKAILDQPRHPYTQLLLESLPLIGKKWEKKPFTDADIETKEYRLGGCKFRMRCPFTKDICVQIRPSPMRQADGRDVYCHFADQFVRPIAEYATKGSTNHV